MLGVLIADPRPLRLADVGAHPHSYGFPSAHPPMDTFLGAPIRVGDRVYGNLYLTEKQAGEIDAADEEALVVLADWAAIAIENARAYSHVQRRRDELEQAVAGFEATSEIADALAGETELEHVLELVAKRARALTEARAMVVLLQAATSFPSSRSQESSTGRWSGRESRSRAASAGMSSSPAGRSASPMRLAACASRSPSRRRRRRGCSSRCASAGGCWACSRASIDCATAHSSALETSSC